MAEQLTINWQKLTNAREAFRILRNERNEKDDIFSFTAAFMNAADAYAKLNVAEINELRKYAIADG